ncbi:unnamed protein product, partial [Rhizoctonia solani]
VLESLLEAFALLTFLLAKALITPASSMVEIQRSYPTFRGAVLAAITFVVDDGRVVEPADADNLPNKDPNELQGQMTLVKYTGTMDHNKGQTCGIGDGGTTSKTDILRFDITKAPDSKIHFNATKLTPAANGLPRTVTKAQDTFAAYINLPDSAAKRRGDYKQELDVMSNDTVAQIWERWCQGKRLQKP